MWRGAALAGIDSLPVQGAAAALAEERIQAWEECLQCELAAGAAGELVAELTELVTQHPLREGPHKLLMLALYRSGRQADALSVYRGFRKRLTDELGTEPSDDLEQLHRGILNRDPALAGDRGSTGPTAAAVPRELPATVADFTGRTAALETLDEFLATSHATDQPGPVVISAIAGTAGVGKTALAVRWAHRVADRFPDGQLYLNLRGYMAGAAPLRPIDALAALLRSLGMPPEQIPIEEDQAAALLRTRLAERRVLIVLDNARSSEQVRSLLPGAPGCLVLLTSRDRLMSLVAEAGARRVTLDVLTPDEAHWLLARLLGKVRVDTEPNAVAALAQACAYLPLALRIAAANLSEPAGRSIATYLAELTGRDHRTDNDADVETDEVVAVYSALGASYRTIPPSTQRLFRLLGLVPGPDITPPAAAALAALSEAEARRELRRLVAAHLLDEHLPDRFAFHDLLRRYARDLAHREDQLAERDQALGRLLTWYLHTADTAATTMHPAARRLPLTPPDRSPLTLSFATFGQAMTWYEAERSNLVAAVQRASKAGSPALAWLIADRLRGYLWTSRRTTDWAAIATTALAAARYADDSRAAAAAEVSLGDLAIARWRYAEAAQHLSSARLLARRGSWSEVEAAIVAKLGQACWRAGRLEDAVAYLRDSLDNARKTDGLGTIGVTQNVLGCVYRELGRLREAADCLAEALSLRRKLNDRPGIAIALNNLGMVYQERGNFSEAIDHFDQALRQCQEIGLRSGEALVRESLAAVYRDTGKLAEALDSARAAVMLARETGDRLTEAEATSTLGDVRLRRGDSAGAMRQYQTALDTAREAGLRYCLVRAMYGQAAAHRSLGSSALATQIAFEALEHARESQYGVLAGHLLMLLADVHLHRGLPTEAHKYASHALDNHRSTGHRLGEARTLAVLSRLASAMHDVDSAAHHAAAAHTLFTKLGIANPDDAHTAS